MKNIIKLCLVTICCCSSLENINAQTWNLSGNALTSPDIHFLGTTDNKALKLKTNNTTRIFVSPTGKVGIANQTPVWRLDVKSGSINTDSLYRINGISVLSATSAGIQIGTTADKVGIGTSTPSDALQVVGAIAATGGRSTDWNTAFSWGNHAVQGYLKGTGLTTGTIPLWNGTSLANSSIVENATFIGIGVSSPSAKLHVSSLSAEGARFNTSGNFTWNSIFENGVYRGYFGSFSGIAEDVDFGTGSSNPSGSLHLTIQGNPKLTIKPTGDVAIGTTIPANGFRLSVAGKVICEELKVQLLSTWPDYVFDEKYPLKSIEEVDAFIGANGHLPGLPSAADMVATGGVELGNMQIKMLEKIEELTLYVIRLNKQLTDLKIENAALKSVK